MTKLTLEEQEVLFAKDCKSFVEYLEKQYSNKFRYVELLNVKINCFRRCKQQ